MQPRPFDWRDLPNLQGYRNETLFLNTALLLTRGPLQALGAMLSSVMPSTGIITAVCENHVNSARPIIGQVIHNADEPYAYLSFLAPESCLDADNLQPLVEYLVAQLGERGVLRMLAEVEEQSVAVDGLRGSGFAVYTRQRVWRLTGAADDERLDTAWRPIRESDFFAVRLLYSNLVPAMVQQVEAISLERPKGLVFYQDDELLAYVELRYGLRGIWVRPYIHPDVEDAAPLLIKMLHKFPSRQIRPIYICVSTYQSWMESLLDEMGAEPGPRQLILAKHLTVQKKSSRVLTIPGLEGHPETLALLWTEK